MKPQLSELLKNGLRNKSEADVIFSEREEDVQRVISEEVNRVQREREQFAESK